MSRINDCISLALVRTDKVLDYVPVVSTVTNLVDIFQKCILKVAVKSKPKNVYTAHLNNKSFQQCLLLLIPVFGNVLNILVYKHNKKVPKNNENAHAVVPITLFSDPLVHITAQNLSREGHFFLAHVNSLAVSGGKFEGRTISTALKKQLVNAAQTSTKQGKIVLHEEFSVKELSAEDLVLLYIILGSVADVHKVHCNAAGKMALDKAKAEGRELSKEELNSLPKPIFEKPIFVLEKHLANLCVASADNQFIIPAKYHEVMAVLAGHVNRADLRKLEEEMAFAVKKFVPFQNRPALTELYKSMGEKNGLYGEGILPSLKVYLEGLTAADRSELLGQLKDNYAEFLVWLESVAEIEKEGPNRIVSILKGQTVDAVTLRNSGLILQLIGIYPDLFQDIMGTGFRAHILPGGMKLLLDKLPGNDSLKAGARFCTSYEDYAKQLEELPKDVKGVYYFFVRTRHLGVDQAIHQAPVTVFKDRSETVAFITDSSTYDLDNVCDHITRHTYKAVPGATVYSTMSVRQRDMSSCGFFTMKDLRAIAKDPDVLFKEIAHIAKPLVQHHKYFNPATRPDLANLKVTAEVPLRLIKTSQSLSQVNSFLKAADKDDPIAQKLALHKHRFTMAEMDLGKDIYAYTTVKVVREHLYLVDAVFKKALIT